MAREILRLTGTLSGVTQLSGTLSLPYGAADVYDGEYEITPALYNDQTLETANKRMSRNVEVYKIPIAQTTNLAGGYTVVVG